MTEVPYIGRLLASYGLKVDPERVRTVQDMLTPTDIPEVQ